MICKLCRKPVALDTSAKTPRAKPHYAEPTAPRFCPCKEAVESNYFDYAHFVNGTTPLTLRESIEAVLQRCFGKGDA